MKCTSCKAGDLIPAYLENLFPCHTCENCGGNLVMLHYYLKWSAENEDTEFVSDASTQVEAQETTKAMLCPKTGRFMTKFRISKDTDHRLDFSPTIGAIWLNKGEWEMLKKQGLAGKLNTIFTSHWQRDVHSDKAVDILTDLYKRRFGEQYEGIKAFREILQSMEDKSAVIAYLLAEDPYEA